VNTTGQNSASTPTQTTARPSASSRNGTASAAVSGPVADEIVRQAVANQSETVVIAPKITGDVTRTEITIPAAAVSSISGRTEASLTVSTPVADVTIPNGGLGVLASSGGAVAVAAGRTGNTVELSVTAGGREVGEISGGVTLTVPLAQSTPGTVAALVRADGAREIIRKSVAVDGSLTIPLPGSATLEIVDNSKTFADVPADAWEADAVSFVTSHQLFNGTSDTTFSPDAPMTRAMLAVVLHNLEGNPAPGTASAFADVSADAWYAEAAAWAGGVGVVTGYADGSFGPNDKLTREQLAVMLWRIAGSPAPSRHDLPFSDADQTGAYAWDAMCWAVERGVMNGRGGGILDPKGLATRAQTAQMLKNFMENQNLLVKPEA